MGYICGIYNMEIKSSILEEIDTIRRIVEENKYRKILIQLPDGLKSYAPVIFERIKDLCEVFFYGNSNFGGCDLPIYLKDDFDAVFHFSHSKYFDTAQENNFSKKS